MAGAVVVWAETIAAAMAVVAMKLAFIAIMKFVLLKIMYMDGVGADVVLTCRIRNNGCENSNATSATNRLSGG